MKSLIPLFALFSSAALAAPPSNSCQAMLQFLDGRSLENCQVTQNGRVAAEIRNVRTFHQNGVTVTVGGLKQTATFYTVTVGWHHASFTDGYDARTQDFIGRDASKKTCSATELRYNNGSRGESGFIRRVGDAGIEFDLRNVEGNNRLVGRCVPAPAPAPPAAEPSDRAVPAN